MLQFANIGSGHLPVMLSIVFTVTVGMTYCFAVWHGDVDPVFPYLSSSGDRRPESCFFSLMLSICGALTISIIYFRYVLLVELIREGDMVLRKLNTLAMVFGLMSAFGLVMVANFQETAVVTVHIASAITCFGFGSIYMLLDAYITVRMYPLYTNKTIGYIRAVLAVISLICFITTISFGIRAGYEFHKYFPDLPTPRPYSSKLNHPGYGYHCVSAVAEWLLAVCNVVYLLSYSRDFEKIRVSLSLQTLVSHLDQSPLHHSYADITSLY